ncbi:myb-like protein V isoform X3 [Daphnia pulicaria]|uniref:myb-like protein V isoform X3 n=1 Tax=Daphnia pulicaria TaxID=35523 RepID=UPI001EEBD289|nr:myb-like protein V isoform X3 [Daphnia pulicaria]
MSPIREASAVRVAAATVAATAVVWMDSTRLELPPPPPPPPRQKRSTAAPVISSVEEARQIIARLTERNTAQGHLLQAWKQRLKQQNEALFGLHSAREEQMRLLTSQLLLLEANLRAKQGKIDGLLNQRDRIISGQQETIRSLERELERCRNCAPSSASSELQPASSTTNSNRPQSLPLTPSAQSNSDREEEEEEVNSDKTSPDESSSNSCRPSPSTVTNPSTTQLQVRVLGREQGDESLDDSDSAVVIDDDAHRHSPTFAQNSQQVRIIRSISDVVDSSRACLTIFRETSQHSRQPGILKSTRLVRNHQRRVMFLQPEEEEEKEEDGGIDEEEEEEDLEDSIGSSGSGSSSDDSPFNKRGHKTFLRGSFERMPVNQDSTGSRGSGLSSSSFSLRAANCSNHRSVTRPRDVKFKKNNKCPWKSISLDGCSPSTPSASQEFQISCSHQV